MKQAVFKNKMLLIIAMVIYGTIGVFRKYLDMPSGVIAMARGVIGALFLLLYMGLTKKKFDKRLIKKNILYLIISGIFLGFNWILLFESYRFTTVATATLCYYMAPVFITVASAFIFKEKLNIRKIICVLTAVTGMALVSGVIGTKGAFNADKTGVLLALSSAVLYAMIVLINKKISHVPALDKTVIQLGISALFLLPYNLLTTDMSALDFNPKAVALLLIMGVIHTGVAYTMYFGSINKLKAQTVAIYGYIDPIVAILCSSFILNEKTGIYGWIGAALILCSTFISEIKSNS